MTSRPAPAASLHYELVRAQDRWDRNEVHMTIQRITFDPKQLGGQACIRNLRIPVATIVRCIASGMSRADILEAYPDLQDEDVSAALQCAAALTEDRLTPVPTVTNRTMTDDFGSETRTRGKPN